MENILNGDTAIYIMAVLSTIVTLEQYLAQTERFKANSSLQVIGNIAGKILKLLKKN